MRAYFVMEDGGDFGIIVVAHNIRQALVMGRRELMNIDDDAEFLEIRVRWLKQITPPETVTKPSIITSCDGHEEWACNAWDCSEEFCRGCKQFPIRWAKEQHEQEI